MSESTRETDPAAFCILDALRQRYAPEADVGIRCDAHRAPGKPEWAAYITGTASGAGFTPMEAVASLALALSTACPIGPIGTTHNEVSCLAAGLQARVVLNDITMAAYGVLARHRGGGNTPITEPPYMAKLDAATDAALQFLDHPWYAMVMLHGIDRG